MSPATTTPRIDHPERKPEGQIGIPSIGARVAPYSDITLFVVAPIQEGDTWKK